MTINLPLEPKEEARLAAVARAKGVSTVTLVREALDKILAEAPDEPQDARAQLAERYARLKQEIVASGTPLLDDDELRVEIRERRGVEPEQGV